MRSVTTSILMMLLLASFANEGELAAEVWIDGSSFRKPIADKNKLTIYFKDWDFGTQQFLDDENYFVALQLNHDFDPLPEDNVQLPDLTTIAALSGKSSLNQYLSFLERLGRTKGINYMILPDTTGLSIFEKEVISKARAKSPYYFLSTQFLSRHVPDTKKEFEGRRMLSSPTIWLTSQYRHFTKVKKWSAKIEGDNKSEFVDALRRAAETEFIPAYELPLGLKKKLVTEGTIVIDPPGALPIHSRGLVYIGSDEKLKAWLSKYTTLYDQPIDGIQRVVDLRFRKQPFEKGDILISMHEVEAKEVSQLIIPANYEGLEIDISKMLFGGSEIRGRHPNARLISDYHFMTYSTEEREGLHPSFKTKLDSISDHAITNHATPGMQVAIVKNGSLVFEKSYGHYTYDSMRQVQSGTLYDLASLTKVIATLPALAHLIDQGKVAMEDSIGQYLPEFVGSNKSSITIKQLLAHQGGLQSYIPFWRMTMDGDRLDAFYYKTPEDEAIDRRSYGYETDPILLDSLKSYIIQSKLIKDTDRYNYSDLGFMILHMIVEVVSEQTFDQFLRETFYDPMGLKSLVFNPISKGLKHESIAPTEYDEQFRNYQVWGEVHDRNAAVFGGVAGHAGLFSNAKDLAKMMSMLLNGGFYGGKRYITPETLEKFNIRHFIDNRRGLGWDKKDGKKDSASKHASDQSFGHTGFSGTMVWADPEEDLIFVFLSNRIYPEANNWRLNNFNTRTKMQSTNQ